MLLILPKSLTSRPAKQHDSRKIPALHPSAYTTCCHPAAPAHEATLVHHHPVGFKLHLMVPFTAWHMTATNNHPSQGSIAAYDVFVIKEKDVLSSVL